MRKKIHINILQCRERIWPGYQGTPPAPTRNIAEKWGLTPLAKPGGDERDDSRFAEDVRPHFPAPGPTIGGARTHSVS